MTKRDDTSPMPLAEAAECCGMCRWGSTEFDTESRVYCNNCPLIIDRLENPEVMRAARAM